jgi:hypothetical protein
MKDRLEQFIDDNRDSFDSLSPSDSGKVWANLSSRRRHNGRGRQLTRYFSRAAGILLIFCLSYVFHDYVSRGRESKLAEKKMNDVYEQLPELREAESYYSNLVSNKMKEIKPFLTENPGISKDVNKDLVELDSIYKSLKNDLKDNVANDQIIEAMIQNYRLKLRILEELQSELKHDNLTENAKPKINI